MASKPKEDKPQGFFPTLIICVVVAFIIIHVAFLKLTSSPDTDQQERSYTEPSSVQAQSEDPSFIEEPQYYDEPSITKESLVTKEASEAMELPAKKESKSISSSKASTQIHKEMPSSSSLQRGYQFHKSGNYDKAASGWAEVITSAQHRNDYTIQLLLACQKETIVNAFKNHESPEQLYYVKWRHSGGECYKVCMGLYKSKEKAEANRKHIPKYFLRGGNRPIVTSVSSLAKGLSRK